MVYQIDPKVMTLKEFGEDNFIQTLKLLEAENHRSDERNRSWFEEIPRVYKRERFLEWFFLMDGDDLAAFSTIQQYYPGCYRILTRTYILRDYRRFTFPDNDTLKSPTMHLLPAQLKWLGAYDTVFMSMQGMRRRRAIARFVNKVKIQMGQDWILHPEMVQTCVNDDDSNCWQNVIYNGTAPRLKSISVDEYQSRWPKEVI
jgi:hypothetical protein